MIAFLTRFRHPVLLIPRQEWGEAKGMGSWPHCCGQNQCWMHVKDMGDPWCACGCLWCRLARLIGRHSPTCMRVVGSTPDEARLIRCCLEGGHSGPCQPRI